MTNKIDFKKQYMEIFQQKKNVISTVQLPDAQYLSVEGEGKPKNPNFKEAIEALYGVAYTIKFLPRKGVPINNYQKYAIPPLEADVGLKEDRTPWWRLMIMQPDFITDEIVSKAIEMHKQRKKIEKLPELKLIQSKAGKGLQTLHQGPYDKVGPIYEKLYQYINDNQIEICGDDHEVYLSDPRKTAPEKLKTIIRKRIK